MKYIKPRDIITFLAVLILFCFALPYLYAQESTPIAQSRQFERQAIAAYQKKDYAAYLDYLTQAERLRPNVPRLLYNLASANALNENFSESLSLLRRIARMGLDFHPEKDSDFEKLSNVSDFQTILKIFEKNREPRNQSFVPLTLPEKDLITESVAYDKKTKRFFIGSVRKGKIVAVEVNGRVKDFSAPTDNLWSVFGIKIDEKRRILWACTAAVPQLAGFSKPDEGKSGIFKYDLDSGKLLKKYVLETTEKHLLGDLVVSRTGDVFATDSIAPVIYRLDSKNNKLEAFLTDKSFVSLQGITFSPDEKSLFVADYSTGIFRIDLKTEKVNAVTAGNQITVLGVDGLYYYKGKLIAIQNGINPQRVVEFELDSNTASIIGCKIIEANHPDFAEPTLGTIIGGDFYFIANSQLEAVNQKGEITDLEKLRSPIILRVPL